MYLIRRTKKNHLVNTVCYWSADVGPLSPDNFKKSVVGRLSQFSYLCRRDRCRCILEGFPQLCIWEKLTSIEVYLLFLVHTGEHAGQSISEMPLISREDLKLVVSFAECDGALSCINITLRRVNKGRSSIMAAARTSEARNTSCRSTWHLQEHEWDPQWWCYQLSQPKSFGLRRLVAVKTTWFLSPLKSQPFSQLSWLSKVSRDSSVNSTCFISNFMYFFAHLTFIFSCFGDNGGFFSGLLNFQSVFRIRFRVVLGRSWSPEFSKIVCWSSQASCVNCTGADVDPSLSPSSKQLCHSVSTLLQDCPNNDRLVLT